MVPRCGFERWLVLQCKVPAFPWNQPVRHVGGLEAECTAACHGVKKCDGLRSHVECLEQHPSGDGFFERGVVHEAFVPALVEFFAGEVEPEGATVVNQRDVEA